MNRLPRNLLNAATVLSFTICAATALLWLQTAYTRKEADIETPSHYIVFVADRGGLGIEISSKRPRGWGTRSSEFDLPYLFYTFRWDYTSGYHRGLYTHAVALLAASALLPAVHVMTAAKRRRHPRNSALCPTCNYDLRATPDRCPECGTIPRESSRPRAPAPAEARQEVRP